MKVTQFNHTNQVIPDQFIRINFEMVPIYPSFEWPKMIYFQTRQWFNFFKEGLSTLDAWLVRFF